MQSIIVDILFQKIKEICHKKIFFEKFFVYINEETNKGGMKSGSFYKNVIFSLFKNQKTCRAVIFVIQCKLIREVFTFRRKKLC